LNRSFSLDKILYGGLGIEYYFDHIPFNPVASTIPIWWTFKLLRWVQLLNRSLDLDKILFADDGIECYLYYILFKLVTSTVP
jgi:hypothetical protein